MALWLKGTKRMTVVISELSTRNSETPDVIGWVGGAESILIECKVNRADFLADGKKWFRVNEEKGMGNLRYVAAPAGLLVSEEIPEGWGLLEVDRFVYEAKPAVRKQANKSNECVMLMSALRRLEIATAVYVVSENEEEEL
jgi:hypothetical protein